MKIKCWWFLGHNWGPWGKVKYFKPDDIHTKGQGYQERVCENCNRLQLRNLPFYKA